MAIFVAEKPFGNADSLIRIRVKHESVHKQHPLGRIRLAVTTSENIPEVGPANIPVEIVKLLQIEAGKRSAEQQAKLREHYRQQITTDAAFVKARTELAAARKGKTDLENSFPTTLIWRELAQPKPAFVLLRGAYDKPGETVTRNTPNRLHLAKWLLSAEHPLTARVIVNRYWQQYFGTGLVETSEDFGSQGTPPSHPELLDWLAVDFRENGWDVKRLQKQIVMSATYQQAVKITPELGKLDPRNRLLARGPRFRFEAEMRYRVGGQRTVEPKNW